MFICSFNKNLPVGYFIEGTSFSPKLYNSGGPKNAITNDNDLSYRTLLKVGYIILDKSTISS